AQSFAAGFFLGCPRGGGSGSGEFFLRVERTGFFGLGFWRRGFFRGFGFGSFGFRSFGIGLGFGGGGFSLLQIGDDLADFGDVALLLEGLAHRAGGGRGQFHGGF